MKTSSADGARATLLGIPSRTNLCFMILFHLQAKCGSIEASFTLVEESEGETMDVEAAAAKLVSIEYLQSVNFVR